ncbi:MAG TPA: shikimate kinase [Pyrinomonadaceae bacterium]|nr:shikimate kinase [Pyrinomonadaceae bacterium]
MGCGKTEVARALARRLGVGMMDLDEIIARQQGRTAAQLIREDGEPAFRAIETKALHDLLESETSGVIALGGGAWITELNRKLIDQYHCISVWLDVPFEVCWRRIEASHEDRPLGRTREQAEERYRVREPIYKLATIRVPALAHEDVESVAARIATDMIDTS